MWRTWYRYKKKQSVQSEPFEYVFQLKSNSKRRKKKVLMIRRPGNDAGYASALRHCNKKQCA